LTTNTKLPFLEFLLPHILEKNILLLVTKIFNFKIMGRDEGLDEYKAKKIEKNFFS
jgi:hypothetical protein